MIFARSLARVAAILSSFSVLPVVEEEGGLAVESSGYMKAVFDQNSVELGRGDMLAHLRVR
jgi:hypothetical protein